MLILDSVRVMSLRRVKKWVLQGKSPSRGLEIGEKKNCENMKKKTTTSLSTHDPHHLHGFQTRTRGPRSKTFLF